jgi:hypothetical protein
MSSQMNMYIKDVADGNYDALQTLMELNAVHLLSPVIFNSIPYDETGWLKRADYKNNNGLYVNYLEFLLSYEYRAKNVLFFLQNFNFQPFDRQQEELFRSFLLKIDFGRNRYKARGFDEVEHNYSDTEAEISNTIKATEKHFHLAKLSRAKGKKFTLE